MKKAFLFLKIFVLVTASCFLIPQFANATLEWTLIEQIDLDESPLDIAATFDGKLIFVLIRGEILIYSTKENKVTNRIPVDVEFDRLTHTIKDNTLVLTGTTAKTVKIIQLETIQKIDISGLPFKGPEKAPVIIAVFSDYQ
jgi:hypothetical protein